MNTKLFDEMIDDNMSLDYHTLEGNIFFVTKDEDIYSCLLESILTEGQEYEGNYIISVRFSEEDTKEVLKLCKYLKLSIRLASQNSDFYVINIHSPVKQSSIISHKEGKLLFYSKLSNLESRLKELENKLSYTKVTEEWIERENFMSVAKIFTNVKANKLNIKNKNSPRELSQECLDYCEELASSDYTKLSSLGFDLPLNYLKSIIPIELVRKEDMITWEQYLDPKGLEGKFLGKRILGRYIYGSSPKIEICPELIEESAENTDPKYIYAKVIIHEFAHAMLDESNWSCFANKSESIENENYSRDFRIVMEESIANCITLHMFDSLKGKDSYDFAVVKKFIEENQPKPYQFGIAQFTAGIEPYKWRMMKDKISPSKADEWLKKYYENGEAYSKECYDKLFE